MKTIKYDLNKVPRKTIAKILGVNPSTVSRWYAAGMPRNLNMSYSIPECVRWALERVEEKFTELTVTRESEESQRWLGEYRKQRALLAKLDLREREGELIPRDEVAAGWAARLSEVASGLQSFSMRLPPLLEGKNQSEMRVIIDDEQWKLRDNYYRTGRFCMPPEETDL